VHAGSGSDPGIGGSPAALRQAMSQFASGVAIVTTRWQGVAHAMTATAFCSVSLEPPLVLVCVNRSSRFHAAITSAQRWAASLLAGDQEHLARHFANRGRDLLSQFEGVPNWPAPVTGSPVLVGAVTWLDCVTYAEHEAGDHTVVVGEIVRTAESGSGLGPLTHYRGSYGRLAT
jgi:flavin reductase